MSRSTPGSPTTRPPSLWQRRIGPGAPPSAATPVVVAAVGGALLGALSVDAPWATRLILAVLAAEIASSLLAQLGEHGKRWAQRPDGLSARRVGVVAVQAVPISTFALLLRDGDPGWIAWPMIVLAAASAAVVALPAHWQRAGGLVLALAGLAALQRTLGTEPEGAWFMPLLFARVLIAWLPAERRGAGDERRDGAPDQP